MEPTEDLAVTGPDRSRWFGLVRWGPIVSVIAVTAAVGAVAAVISYAHQHALNLTHEAAATAWTARFWPVTVEGIVLASGLVLVIRRQAGRPAGKIVWSAMLVGAAVTLAANVASAPIDPRTGEPDRTAQMMNAWPPLAFLFAVELLVIAFRPGAAGPVPDLGEQRVRRVRRPLPDRWRVLASHFPRRVNVPDQPTGPVRPGFSSANSDGELSADLVAWALERGGPVPRDEAMPAYRIGRTRWDRLRSGLGWADTGPDQSGTRSARRNGSGE